MNDLNKEQLILLALLISFVTSLATGIVTVSLMDQAPKNVVQTIKQVVERAVNADTQSATVARLEIIDPVMEAVNQISKNIVKIKSPQSDKILALGFIMNKKGIVFVDKNKVKDMPIKLVVLNDGRSIDMISVREEISGGISFLAPGPNTISFDRASTTSAFDTGKTIYAISGLEKRIVLSGILSEIKNDGDKTFFVTSIPHNKLDSGSPLFDINGNILGIYIQNSNDENYGSTFYSISDLEKLTP